VGADLEPTVELLVEETGATPSSWVSCGDT